MLDLEPIKEWLVDTEQSRRYVEQLNAEVEKLRADELVTPSMPEVSLEVRREYERWSKWRDVKWA